MARCCAMREVVVASCTTRCGSKNTRSVLPAQRSVCVNDSLCRDRCRCRRRCCCMPTTDCNKSRDPLDLQETLRFRRKLRPALRHQSKLIARIVGELSVWLSNFTCTYRRRRPSRRGKLDAQRSLPPLILSPPVNCC